MRNWSAKLFSVFGIRVEVHVTFLLLLALFCWQGAVSAGPTGALAAAIGLFLVFTSVLLHELGHCLVAMRYGIRIPYIMLLPIGGMAMMSRIPKKPSAELAITAAGPAVNFVIAGILYLWVGPPHFDWYDGMFSLHWQDLIRMLIMWNVTMGLFNLIPVFPMDGGRIFRALLAMRFSYLDATRVATYTAKALIVVGIGFALLSDEKNFLLAALFAFIWVGGDAEYRQVRHEEIFKGLKVADVTLPWLGGADDPALNGQHSLSADWALDVYARIFEAGPPRLYPVYEKGHFIGVVDTSRLEDALKLAQRRKRAGTQHPF